MSTQTNNGPEKEMTSEEIAAYTNKMSKYYSERLPLLRLHREYDCLVADIDEARVRSLEAKYKLAEILGPLKEKEKEAAPGPTNL